MNFSKEYGCAARRRLVLLIGEEIKHESRRTHGVYRRDSLSPHTRGRAFSKLFFLRPLTAGGA